MKHDIPNAQIELWRGYAVQERSAGQAEFLLALDRSIAKGVDPGSLQAAIIGEIDQMRSPFTGGLNTFSSEQWMKIRAQSETAARDILLSESTEHKELTKLLSEADIAQREANVKQQQLESSWNEFSAIPAAWAEELELQRRITSERSQLVDGLAEKQYRDLYRSAILYPERDCSDGSQLVYAIVTSPIRQAVLAQLEKESEKRREKLGERNKELAKKLGRPAWKL